MSTTIETITVTRPMKVIAYTLTAISFFLLIGATSSSSWVTNGTGWREGLFEQCVDKGSALPLPFGVAAEEGCSRVRGAGYIRGVGALMIIGIFTDFFGALLTGLGLRSTDPNKKYKYYRVAIYSMIVAVLVLFLAVIIYPVSFAKDAAKVDDYAGYEMGSAAAAAAGDLDFDNDGIIDSLDNDDDNDGVPDSEDNDDDNDGIPDNQDNDDDNDGIPDELDKDVQSDGDLDDDGVPDSEDNDDDNDGVPDALDTDDDNDGIPDDLDDDADGDDEELHDKDTDGDGIPDKDDADIDGDGTLNVDDEDDDGDGVEDDEDLPSAGDPVVFSWGFGYGATWVCLIAIFISLVLLICDRESEEIFYKERAVEEEEEEEA